jgi:hypothetical protein
MTADKTKPLDLKRPHFKLTANRGRLFRTGFATCSGAVGARSRPLAFLVKSVRPKCSFACASKSSPHRQIVFHEIDIPSCGLDAARSLRRLRKLFVGTQDRRALSNDENMMSGDAIDCYAVNICHGV